MCFKIYAYEEVEKRGKMTRESFGGRDSVNMNMGMGRSPFESRGKFLFFNKIEKSSQFTMNSSTSVSTNYPQPKIDKSVLDNIPSVKTNSGNSLDPSKKNSAKDDKNTAGKKKNNDCIIY